MCNANVMSTSKMLPTQHGPFLRIVRDEQGEEAEGLRDIGSSHKHPP